MCLSLWWWCCKSGKSHPCRSKQSCVYPLQVLTTDLATNWHFNTSELFLYHFTLPYNLLNDLCIIKGPWLWLQEGFTCTFALFFCFCRVRSLRPIIWHPCGSCPAFSFARITNMAWVLLWRERLLAPITTREGISSLVWGYDAGRTHLRVLTCHDWNYCSCQNISLPVLWLCRWMAWMSFVWGRPPNLLLITADRERWALIRVV